VVNGTVQNGEARNETAQVFNVEREIYKTAGKRCRNGGGAQYL